MPVQHAQNDTVKGKHVRLDSRTTSKDTKHEITSPSFAV